MLITVSSLLTALFLSMLSNCLSVTFLSQLPLNWKASCLSEIRSIRLGNLQVMWLGTLRALALWETLVTGLWIHTKRQSLLCASCLVSGTRFLLFLLRMSPELSGLSIYISYISHKFKGRANLLPKASGVPQARAPIRFDSRESNRISNPVTWFSHVVWNVTV
jgi:hypothetical protein